MKGRQICLVRKCLKTINSALPKLLNEKGCDASNVYDEEIREDEEFSDDEKERAHKKSKKNKKKRGAGALDDLEEGEIPGGQAPDQPLGYGYQK